MTREDINAIKAQKITAPDMPVSMNKATEKLNELAIEWEEHPEHFDDVNPFFVAIRIVRDKGMKWKHEESRAKVPCICGSKKRETWLGNAGWQFKCMKCGRRSPWGKTEKEAIQNWNKMVEDMRVKQDGTNE